jgi:hypothetical protein
MINTTSEKDLHASGGQNYYDYLLDQCSQPQLEKEESKDHKPNNPLIIERWGKKLIYNGHVGTFVDYNRNE